MTLCPGQRGGRGGGAVPGAGGPWSGESTDVGEVMVSTDVDTCVAAAAEIPVTTFVADGVDVETAALLVVTAESAPLFFLDEEVLVGFWPSVGSMRRFIIKPLYLCCCWDGFLIVSLVFASESFNSLPALPCDADTSPVAQASPSPSSSIDDAAWSLGNSKTDATSRTKGTSSSGRRASSQRTIASKNGKWFRRPDAPPAEMSREVLETMGLGRIWLSSPGAIPSRSPAMPASLRTSLISSSLARLPRACEGKPIELNTLLSLWLRITDAPAPPLRLAREARRGTIVESPTLRGPSGACKARWSRRKLWRRLLISP
mmetsp:Transcript_19586/g.37764  ORF Transcript_19586/g.37764 Transcript_19586/m.37764 type:complete len:316 (-) Transcript_19586:311-1258(-)